MRTDFGGGSRRSQLLALVLRHTARRVIFAWSLVPHGPWPYGLVDHVGRLQKRVPGTTISRLDLPRCRAELIRTPASRPDRVIVYFHGGAFVVGGRHLHHGLISRIADATASTVLAVEYRKLPRHPIATSVADGLDAYQHVLGLGIDPADIVFMGDSAGGFMTFTVMDRVVADGLPVPAGIVAMSPLIDLDLERTPLGEQASRGCDVFGPRAIPTFARVALRRAGFTGLHCPRDCRVESFPPVLLQVSSSESLYGQVCAYAEYLEGEGVDTELQVWDGQVHVFQAARPLPEAQQAVAEVAAFVERVTAAIPRQRTA